MSSFYEMYDEFHGEPPRAESDKYEDSQGNELKKGLRFRIEDGGPDVGVIDFISDPDGDVDDEGRSVYYPATVHVTFDDGTTEVYPFYWTGTYYTDGPHVCEEIEVVTP